MKHYHITATLGDITIVAACFQAASIAMAQVIARALAKSWEVSTFDNSTPIVRDMLKLREGTAWTPKRTHLLLCEEYGRIAVFWAPNTECAALIARKLSRTYSAKRHMDVPSVELKLKALPHQQ